MATRKINSTNNINRNLLMNACGTMYALNLLSRRWTFKILYKLATKNMRFTEIKKHIPNITDRMLTLHLKEMEQNGLIERTIFAEVPPRVEYKLTQSTINLIPVWERLEKWGDEHRENQVRAALQD